MGIYFSICIGIIILDFTTIGFFAWAIRLYPSYRGLLKQGFLIHDKTCNLSLSWNGHRYHSLYLTGEYLILRNSLFTSVINICISEIDSFEIKRTIAGGSVQKLLISFTLDDKKKTVKIKTTIADQWAKAFAMLGIHGCEV